MKIKLAGFFHSYRVFISGAGRSVLFTSLFYALWLVISCISAQRFDLHSFSGRMIGISTLEAYDVGARVSLFYKCVLLLVTSFLLLNLAGYFIFSKKAALLSSAETRIINYTSIAGILLFVFQLFESEVSESLEIIYFIHKFMLAGLFLRLVFFRKNDPGIYHYALVLCLGTCFHFLISDCFNLSGLPANPDFYITGFLSSCSVLIFLHIVLKKDHLHPAKPLFRSLAYALVPLASLPLVSVLKDEVFLVLKTNQVFIHPVAVFVMLLLLLSGLIILRFRSAGKRTVRSETGLIALGYFPILIFSLITYTFYSRYIEYSSEVFESANRNLAIMEFKLFGVIPTLEKFNSHLLSDYFFSAIYTFFNGLQGAEMELYDFLLIPVSFTLFYYVAYYLTHNAFIAAFSVLLFPFSGTLLPGGYCLAIMGLFVLNKILEPRQSLKKYLLFFAALIFLVYWRIDIGYSCMVILPLILLYYHFIGTGFKISWPLLFKGLVITVGLTLIIIALLSYYRHVNLFSKMLYALNYFTSAQTYGYSTIGWTSLPAYKMHYFVFPIITCLILIALAVKFKSLNKSATQRLSYLSLVFLCAYYLINFNRGLIRHSLIENTDSFTSSFIYLILPGSVFIFFRKQSQTVKYIAFCAISFFAIASYKLPPETKGLESLFETCMLKIKAFKNTDIAKVGDRVSSAPSDPQHKTLLDFLQTHTGPEETFIDFTGHPMFYFYIRKITPSYFYQNPVCSHNEFLQKKYISDLSEYNVPYLLFAELNEQGYNHVDRVPNTLRHYRMTEYFYNNYKPYIIVDSICIWRKNQVVDNNKKDTVFSFMKQAAPIDTHSILKARLKVKAGKKYLVKITSDVKTDIRLTTSFASHSAPAAINYVTDTLSYSMVSPKGLSLDLSLENKSQAINGFSVIECDYFPDFYSEKFLSYDFKKLPYVWGTYDKEVFTEKVLYQDRKPVILEENLAYRYKIPETLDKKSGNTVILTCKNNSKKIHHLILFFGNSGERNITTVSFNILPSKKEEKYAVRISSIYKWLSGKTDQIGFLTGSNKNITITDLQITKAK